MSLRHGAHESSRDRRTRGVHASYNDPSGDAPGAAIPSTIGRDVDHRDYSRGTR